MMKLFFEILNPFQLLLLQIHQGNTRKINEIRSKLTTKTLEHLLV